MTQLLRPEFTDRKKCAACGAPAARLIRVMDVGDSMSTFDVPVEIRRVRDGFGSTRPVKAEDNGAEFRQLAHKKGDEGEAFYVIPITHECRSTFNDGVLVSFGCGGLSSANVVSSNTMPDECWYDRTTTEGAA